MDNARILLVDDDTALLQALPQAVSLRMTAVQVDTSDSALQALDLIKAQDYDAIVSDIKMPGMDGLTLLSHIQQWLPQTPTLLITGHGEHELTVQALRGGAYDFIQKPIDRDGTTSSPPCIVPFKRTRCAGSLRSSNGRWNSMLDPWRRWFRRAHANWWRPWPPKMRFWQWPPTSSRPR